MSHPMLQLRNTRGVSSLLHFSNIHVSVSTTNYFSLHNYTLLEQNCKSMVTELIFSKEGRRERTGFVSSSLAPSIFHVLYCASGGWKPFCPIVVLLSGQDNRLSVFLKMRYISLSKHLQLQC